jgi:hypothetical protein
MAGLRQHAAMIALAARTPANARRGMPIFRIQDLPVVTRGLSAMCLPLPEAP